MTEHEEVVALRAIFLECAAVVCRRQQLPRDDPRRLVDGTLNPNKVPPHEVPKYIRAIDEMLRMHDINRCSYRGRAEEAEKRLADVLGHPEPNQCLLSDCFICQEKRRWP